MSVINLATTWVSNGLRQNWEYIWPKISIKNFQIINQSFNCKYLLIQHPIFPRNNKNHCQQLIHKQFFFKMTSSCHLVTKQNLNSAITNFHLKSQKVYISKHLRPPLLSPTLKRHFFPLPSYFLYMIRNKKKKKQKHCDMKAEQEEENSFISRILMRGAVFPPHLIVGAFF